MSRWKGDSYVLVLAFYGLVYDLAKVLNVSRVAIVFRLLGLVPLAERQGHRLEVAQQFLLLLQG